jgi:hypothetical protein
LKHNLTTDEKSDTVWNPNKQEDNEKSFDITDITFERNKAKEGKLESVRMRYYFGYEDVHSEWLFFKHPQFSFPYDKTVALLTELCKDPKQIDFLFESSQPEIDLTDILSNGLLNVPIKLDIRRQKKNPKYFETVRRYYAKEEGKEDNGSSTSDSSSSLGEDYIPY